MNIKSSHKLLSKTKSNNEFTIDTFYHLLKEIDPQHRKIIIEYLQGFSTETISQKFDLPTHEIKHIINMYLFSEITY